MNMHSRTISVQSRPRKNKQSNSAPIPASDARAIAEQLFKKPAEPVAEEQDASPAPAEKRAPKRELQKLSIQMMGSKVRLRFRKELWEEIGRPARLDVTGTPEMGLQIRPGSKLKPSISSSSLSVDTTSNRLHFPQEHRPVIYADPIVKDGYICTDSLSGFATPAIEQPKDEGTVHDAGETSPRPDPDKHSRDLGTISAQVNAAGARLAIYVPLSLLDQIDSPARVVVTGSVHEGFVATPTTDPHDGRAVAYVEASKFGMLFLSLKQQNMSIVARRPFTVQMHIEDGKLKIAGPNYEWIRGADFWLRKKDGNGFTQSHDVSSPSATARYISPGTQYQNVPDRVEIEKITSDLGNELRIAREIMQRVMALKTRLETQTGLKYVITSKMTLGVHLPGMAETTQPQKDIPIITDAKSLQEAREANGRAQS